MRADYCVISSETPSINHYIKRTPPPPCCLNYRDYAQHGTAAKCNPLIAHCPQAKHISNFSFTRSRDRVLRQALDRKLAASFARRKAVKFDASANHRADNISAATPCPGPFVRPGERVSETPRSWRHTRTVRARPTKCVHARSF